MRKTTLMKEINILWAGCSFTEMPHWERWLPMVYYEEYNIKINIVNIGESSFGNTQIADRVFTYLEDNPKINFDLVIIQWSAFTREQTLAREEYEKESYDPNLPDFSTGNIINHTHSEYLINYNLDVMNTTRKKLKGMNLNYKMYFGWAQITNLDFQFYPKLEKQMKILENDDDFWLYSHSSGVNPRELAFQMTRYDPVEFFRILLKEKKVSRELLPIINSSRRKRKNLKPYPANDYGGYAEYVRDEIGVAGFLYNHLDWPHYDGHPNLIGSYFFWNGIVHKWIMELL
mgnify:CR=1 FL=1